MKRLFILILAALVLAGSAAADGIDLSSMSFNELVALREQLNLAIWNSREWQEVEVPAGIWKIGEDIPAGHWTIRAKPPKGYYSCAYCDRLNEQGTDVGMGFKGWNGILSARDDDDMHQFDIEMEEGYWFKCNGPILFTPYAGKPDLGFK